MYLDISSNQVSDLATTSSVCKLPCLEELNLSGNPVTTCIDYRVRILEQFDQRTQEICLDNERPTQKELDKVIILQALRAAREGFKPKFDLSPPKPCSPLELSRDIPDVGTIAEDQMDF